jgi:hypothetical protein
MEEANWRNRAECHGVEARTYLAPWKERSRAGKKHPVYDFLFTYYRLRPSELERWHPGFGVVLEWGEERPVPARYRRVEGGIGVDWEALRPRRESFVRWLEGLLRSIGERPAFFGCAGLHEWAMVYRTGGRVRHEDLPLRLSPSEIDGVVDSLPVCCSHYDAFRFFTPEAVGKNRLQPESESKNLFEQGGCLHTNMDLYKWCGKLLPLVSTELLWKAFLLAVEIRELDMRASPYDVSKLGKHLSPVPVETVEGRRQYEACQRAFAARAAPLRNRLLSLCRALLT